MGRLLKRLVISLSAVSLVLIFGVAQAQTSQLEGIQISPLTFDYEIAPGGSESSAIYITNKSTTDDLVYTTETEDFKNTSQEGAPSFEGVASDDEVSSLADWIEVTSNPEGTLKPGATVQIDFKINVPTDAEPGGHYAALFAKQVKALEGDETEVGVLSRVGALILVSVPGDVTKTATITEFNPPKIVWWGPIDLSMIVENTGTVHYDSQGTVSIDPLLGKTGEIDMGTHTILPKNTRLYEGTWQNKIPFGYYKLTAIATDGDGNEISSEKGVFAIPLVIVLPLLTLLLVIWFIVKVLKKKYNITKDNGNPPAPTSQTPPPTPPAPPVQGQMPSRQSCYLFSSYFWVDICHPDVWLCTKQSGGSIRSCRSSANQK